MIPPADARAVYEERRERFAQEERRLARKSFRFSVVRGVLFFLFAAGLAYILWNARSAGWEEWVAAAVPFIAFLAILPAHDRLIAEQSRFADLQRLNEHALARLGRDWASLPPPGLSGQEEAPLARDLNLFGHASLFHLLGTAHSPPGKTALASWLMSPAGPEEIAERQRAVTELAPEIELRQQLEAGVLALEKAPPDIEIFLRWAEGEPWLRERPWLIWLVRLLAVATLAAGAAALFTPFPLWPLLFLATVNLSLSKSYLGPVLAIFDRVSAREREFQLYATAMERIAGRPYAAPWLGRIAAELAPDGWPAHRWMARLHSRVDLSDVRHSTLLHFFLQVLLLWDFHILDLLERWQVSAGRHVREWLAALGRFEAAAALAGLRFDEPGWAFPEVARTSQAAPGEGRLTARALGHPLIAETKRVANDVEVGPPGTFLLVTGSNMSGKSTLLRSIGINAVLAQAGGPVCAEALRLPPLRLATSILIEDSLADGVSFFMAELRRVRQIVDAADECRSKGCVLLYLLDEILRGTNSRERQIAVRRVLLHLLRQGAIGAVSTHDLEIAGLEELRSACLPVHFRETLNPGPGAPPMTFDYQLRPGVATTVNALKLLEMVGIAPEGDV